MPATLSALILVGWLVSEVYAFMAFIDAWQTHPLLSLALVFCHSWMIVVFALLAFGFKPRK